METKTMTYMQALRLAMDEELARDDKVILLGQDVGILGGAYGVTGDLYHKYGPDRIIDSPLAENAIVGFGIGAAMMGWRPIMEIMTTITSILMTTAIPTITCTHTPTATSTTFTPLLTACSLPIK
jgi:pyruvate dehydrogenase E1 component beta subunit